MEQERPGGGPVVDVVLQVLAEAFNRVGAGGGPSSMSVTLTVHGLIVTGEMVSAHEYLEGLTGDLGGEAGALLKTALELGDDVFSPTLPAQGLPSPQFVHLRGARFFYPIGARGTLVPAGVGGWWRTRLESIDGFGVGTLLIKKADGQDEEAAQ